MARLSVVGAGVIGLSAARELQSRGHRVSIFASDLPTETTSSIAAAIWFPYLAEPADRVREWSLKTLHKFQRMARNTEAGVTLRTGHLIEAPSQDAPWWSTVLAEEPRTATNPANTRSTALGRHLKLPIATMPRYLTYLHQSFLKAGGVLFHQTVTDLAKLPGDAVINCSGLGSRHLCDDPKLVPIRGQVVVAQRPASPWLIDDRDPSQPCYIIPRLDCTILGGTAEHGDDDLRPNANITEQIIARTTDLVPDLAQARLLDVRVGLRPGRTSVRLEAEQDALGRPLIHNYGHGGSGVTMSWGCAEEVGSLLERIM